MDFLELSWFVFAAPNCEIMKGFAPHHQMHPSAWQASEAEPTSKLGIDQSRSVAEKGLKTGRNFAPWNECYQGTENPPANERAKLVPWRACQLRSHGLRNIVGDKISLSERILSFV